MDTRHLTGPDGHRVERAQPRLPLAPLVIAAVGLIITVVVLTVYRPVIRDMMDGLHAWEDNAATVQLALNERYHEDITVERDIVPGGKGPSTIEHITIDGVPRYDCEVTSDTSLTLECRKPLTLTREP